MPEGENREHEAQVASFIEHIKKLQDELRDKDGTVVLIDAKDLTGQEMEMWDEYIELLEITKNVLESLQHQPDNQEAIRKLLRVVDRWAVRDPQSIAGRSMASQKKLRSDGQDGRAQFYNWLNNRLNPYTVNLPDCPKEFITGDKDFLANDLPKIIEMVKVELTRMK